MAGGVIPPLFHFATLIPVPTTHSLKATIDGIPVSAVRGMLQLHGGYYRHRGGDGDLQVPDPVFCHRRNNDGNARYGQAGALPHAGHQNAAADGLPVSPFRYEGNDALYYSRDPPRPLPALHLFPSPCP